MTLDETLELAQRLVFDPAHEGDTHDLAKAIIDLVGEDQPCGFDPPLVLQHPGQPATVAVDGVSEFSPGEARAYAATILRAADRAEEASAS